MYQQDITQANTDIDLCGHIIWSSPGHIELKWVCPCVRKYQFYWWLNFQHHQFTKEGTWHWVYKQIIDSLWKLAVILKQSIWQSSCFSEASRSSHQPLKCPQPLGSSTACGTDIQLPGTVTILGLILGLCPANKSQRYLVMMSLIGWAQT